MVCFLSHGWKIRRKKGRYQMLLAWSNMTALGKSLGECSRGFTLRSEIRHGEKNNVFFAVYLFWKFKIAKSVFFVIHNHNKLGKHDWSNPTRTFTTDKKVLHTGLVSFQCRSRSKSKRVAWTSISEFYTRERKWRKSLWQHSLTAGLRRKKHNNKIYTQVSLEINQICENPQGHHERNVRNWFVSVRLF